MGQAACFRQKAESDGGSFHRFAHLRRDNKAAESRRRAPPKEGAFRPRDKGRPYPKKPRSARTGRDNDFPKERRRLYWFPHNNGTKTREKAYFRLPCTFFLLSFSFYTKFARKAILFVQKDIQIAFFRCYNRDKKEFQPTGEKRWMFV